MIIRKDYLMWTAKLTENGTGMKTRMKLTSIESLMNFGIGTAMDSVIGISRIWDDKCEKNLSVFQKFIKNHLHK